MQGQDGSLRQAGLRGGWASRSEGIGRVLQGLGLPFLNPLPHWLGGRRRPGLQLLSEAREILNKSLPATQT